MITLKRHTTGEQGTFGVLLRDNLPIADTIERQWLNNRNKVSCIPEGIYNCVPYLSPSKGYEVWLLENVPGRDFIEIHVANYADELLGCIAPGNGYIKGMENGEFRTGVANSKITFGDLKSVLPKTFTLSIIDLFRKDE